MKQQNIQQINCGKLTEYNITELGKHSTRTKIQDRTSGLNCRLTVGELTSTVAGRGDVVGRAG